MVKINFPKVFFSKQPVKETLKDQIDCEIYTIAMEAIKEELKAHDASLLAPQILKDNSMKNVETGAIIDSLNLDDYNQFESEKIFNKAIEILLTNK